MPSKDRSSQRESLELRPGRFRAAWRALMGQPVVPAQIRAEWAEMQLVFHDMLTQLSASLARQAKAEKKRLERLRELSREASEGQHLPQTPRSSAERKAQLRRFAFHGGERPPSFSQMDLPLNGDQPGENE